MDEDNFNRVCRHFAGELKAARKQIGLSQEALALSADVDRTYVSQLERGVANPSLSIICRLAAALQVDLQLSLTPHQERSQSPTMSAFRRKAGSSS